MFTVSKNFVVKQKNAAFLWVFLMLLCILLQYTICHQQLQCFYC